MFDSQALNLVNKSFYRPLRYVTVRMRINKMDSNTLYIATYAEASLANNTDLSSQISGLVVFCDLLGEAAFTQYWSRKGQRVTLSTLADKEIAFTTVFDSVFMLRHAASEILGQRVPLFALTDSYSLFQVIAKGNPVREKRLLIDAAILKDAYYSGSPDNLGFIRTRLNTSDPLFKDIADESLLLSLLRDVNLDDEVEEFITEDIFFLATANASNDGREVDPSLLLED